MSLNTQLIEAAESGKTWICHELKEEGAYDFLGMFRAAAEDGDMDMCRLAIEWYDEAAEKGEKKEVDTEQKVRELEKPSVTVKHFVNKDSGLYIMIRPKDGFILKGTPDVPRVVAFFDCASNELKHLTPGQVREVTQMGLKYVPGLTPAMPEGVVS